MADFGLCKIIQSWEETSKYTPCGMFKNITNIINITNVTNIINMINIISIINTINIISIINIITEQNLTLHVGTPKWAAPEVLRNEICMLNTRDMKNEEKRGGREGREEEKEVEN